MTAAAGHGGEPVCVDASLVLGWVLPGRASPEADLVLRAWEDRGAELVGPALLYAEATSVIRHYVATGRLSDEEGNLAFARFDALGVSRVDHDDLHRLAWELARRYRQSRAYDMFYLALARIEKLPLWTSDARLARAVGPEEPLLHFVPVLP